MCRSSKFGGFFRTVIFAENKIGAAPKQVNWLLKNLLPNMKPIETNPNIPEHKKIDKALLMPDMTPVFMPKIPSEYISSPKGPAR